MKNLKVVPYSRIAKADQQGHNSLELQKNQIETFCKEKGFEIVAMYEDIVSGKDQNKTGLNKAVKYLMENKECAKTLIAVNMDRISRDIVFNVDFINRMEQYGIAVITINDGAKSLEQILKSLPNQKRK